MKIFGNDLPSLVESLYLGIERTDHTGECSIVVNPERITYLIGKTVIINKYNYPKDSIEGLVSNGCRVISRTFKREGVIFDPYRLRLNLSIVWNGDIMESVNEDTIDDLFYYFENNKIYFPKVKLYNEHPSIPNGYNYLSYLLQQVGQTIWTGETLHQDLDLAKTKKGRW